MKKRKKKKIKSLICSKRNFCSTNLDYIFLRAVTIAVIITVVAVIVN